MAARLTPQIRSTAGMRIAQRARRIDVGVFVYAYSQAIDQFTAKPAGEQCQCQTSE